MIRFLNKFISGVIRFYQLFISPLKPPTCRFHPSCSQYALESIKIHGIFKGAVLSLWRILRCNPFSSGGYDPVPVHWPIVKKETSFSHDGSFMKDNSGR